MPNLKAIRQYPKRYGYARLSKLLFRFSICILLVSPLAFPAQDLSPEVYSSLKFRHIGPEGNRVIAIAGHSGHPHLIYAGAASGGGPGPARPISAAASPSVMVFINPRMVVDLGKKWGSIRPDVLRGLSFIHRIRISFWPQRWDTAMARRMNGVFTGPQTVAKHGNVYFSQMKTPERPISPWILKIRAISLPACGLSRSRPGKGKAAEKTAACIAQRTVAKPGKNAPGACRLPLPEKSQLPTHLPIPIEYML